VTGVAAIVPADQVARDFRRAADIQSREGWGPVHWLDHKTGHIGIFGALRMAIYTDDRHAVGIASYTTDPTFTPTDGQRARILRASEVLNEYVMDHYSVRYAFDWNAKICTGTDDAVALFRSAANALERTQERAQERAQERGGT
jgi:hypothetical protein